MRARELTDPLWGRDAFQLCFKHLDGDGIKELIFENGRQREVEAFRPAKGSQVPVFKVLERVGVGVRWGN